ncbi:MAG: hypothetical protein ABI890_14580 [Lapillicoccus sp.]
MGFWIVIAIVLVVIVVTALLLDHRRRGGWARGYSGSSGTHRESFERNTLTKPEAGPPFSG